MCACDDSVPRAEKFRRSIDGLKRGALIGCYPRNFCAQNDVFVGVRVGFVLRLTLDKQIGMCPPPEGADIFLGNFMLSSNIVAHSGLFFFCLRLYGFAFILRKEKSGVKSFQRNLLTTLRLQAVCRSMKPMNFADGGCHPTRPEMRFFFTPQMCWYFQMLSARKPVGCLLLFCRRLILIKIQRWDGKI